MLYNTVEKLEQHLATMMHKALKRTGSVGEPAPPKSIQDVQDVLVSLLFDWDVPSQIIMDNESTFVSNVVEQRIRNLGIEIYKTPIHRSETNGQIERCHSTIREIVRCIKSENSELPINDIIQLAVHKYNNSIHSFIQNTPHNILLGENEQNLTYVQSNRQRNMSNDKIADIFRTKDKKIRQDFKYQTFDPGTVA